jgi:hypothetical protein
MAITKVGTQATTFAQSWTRDVGGDDFVTISVATPSGIAEGDILIFDANIINTTEEEFASDSVSNGYVFLLNDSPLPEVRGIYYFKVGSTPPASVTLKVFKSNPLAPSPETVLTVGSAVCTAYGGVSPKTPIAHCFFSGSDSFKENPLLERTAPFRLRSQNDLLLVFGRVSQYDSPSTSPITSLSDQLAQFFSATSGGFVETFEWELDHQTSVAPTLTLESGTRRVVGKQFLYEAQIDNQEVFRIQMPVMPFSLSLETPLSYFKTSAVGLVLIDEETSFDYLMPTNLFGVTGRGYLLPEYVNGERMIDNPLKTTLLKWDNDLGAVVDSGPEDLPQPIALEASFNSLGACLRAKAVFTEDLNLSPYSYAMRFEVVPTDAGYELTGLDSFVYWSGVVTNSSFINGLYEVILEGYWVLFNDASRITRPTLLNAIVGSRNFGSVRLPRIKTELERFKVWGEVFTDTHYGIQNASWGVGPDGFIVYGDPDSAESALLAFEDASVFNYEKKQFSLNQVATSWYGVGPDDEVLSKSVESSNVGFKPRKTISSVVQIRDYDEPVLLVPEDAGRQFFSGPSYDISYIGLAVLPLKVINPNLFEAQRITASQLSITIGEGGTAPSIVTRLTAESIPIQSAQIPIAFSRKITNDQERPDTTPIVDEEGLNVSDFDVLEDFGRFIGPDDLTDIASTLTLPYSAGAGTMTWNGSDDFIVDDLKPAYAFVGTSPASDFHCVLRVDGVGVADVILRKDSSLELRPFFSDAPLTIPVGSTLSWGTCSASAPFDNLVLLSRNRYTGFALGYKINNLPSDDYSKAYFFTPIGLAGTHFPTKVMLSDGNWRFSVLASYPQDPISIAKNVDRQLRYKEDVIGAIEIPVSVTVGELSALALQFDANLNFVGSFAIPTGLASGFLFPFPFAFSDDQSTLYYAGGLTESKGTNSAPWPVNNLLTCGTNNVGGVFPPVLAIRIADGDGETLTDLFSDAYNTMRLFDLKATNDFLYVSTNARVYDSVQFANSAINLARIDLSNNEIDLVWNADRYDVPPDPSGRNLFCKFGKFEIASRDPLVIIAQATRDDNAGIPSSNYLGFTEAEGEEFFGPWASPTNPGEALKFGSPFNHWKYFTPSIVKINTASGGQVVDIDFCRNLKNTNGATNDKLVFVGVSNNMVYYLQGVIPGGNTRYASYILKRCSLAGVEDSGFSYSVGNWYATNSGITSNNWGELEIRPELISSIKTDDDGNVYFAYVDTYGTQAKAVDLKSKIVKLSSTATPDPFFTSPIFNGAIGSIEFTDDESLIYVAGNFTTVNDKVYAGFCVLDFDGEIQTVEQSPIGA